MDRGNHYEVAFEAYIHWLGLCCVAVDETKRSLVGDSSVKSLDFLVYGPLGARLLVDVKGRKFPGGTSKKPRPVWQNWTTEQDMQGLESWLAMFGAGYQGVIVFAYHLQDFVQIPEDTVDLWHWREQRYLFRAVEATAYRAKLRVRSPKWQTVGLSSADFRDLARPISDFLYQVGELVDDTPFEAGLS